MANALITLALEGMEHAQRIELIIEQKAASEAKALANAVTPELESAIKAMTAKLASIRKLHEAPGAAASSASIVEPAGTGGTGATGPAASAVV